MPPVTKPGSTIPHLEAKHGLVRPPVGGGSGNTRLDDTTCKSNKLRHPNDATTGDHGPESPRLGDVTGNCSSDKTLLDDAAGDHGGDKTCPGDAIGDRCRDDAKLTNCTGDTCDDESPAR